MKKIMKIEVMALVVVFAVTGLTASVFGALSPKEELGKRIFFDQNLSINKNQSCAVCHGPKVGWTGPDEAINARGAVYEGSIPGAFGDRKPPSTAYAGDSPILYQTKKGNWVGGMFWDGRATGWTLGDPLAEQALGPFLNPKEQALPNPKAVVDWICSNQSGYWTLFLDVWGLSGCDEVDTAFDYVGFSIAAYERSAEVSAFTSTFDQSRKGKAKLSRQAQRGFALFQGKGKCTKCHVSEGQKPLFTDFTYDNLGVPKNPENPVYVGNPDFVDLGLGGFLRAAGYHASIYGPELGKFKVATLRNVDKRPNPSFVKAFAHNGYFKSLEGIVHFYNTRDVLPTCPGDYTEDQALTANCWPAPEFAANMNTAELGDLGLTPEDEADIVAFLRTLTDTTTAEPPVP
jgi:cytochrome c peroxidase